MSSTAQPRNKIKQSTEAYQRLNARLDEKAYEGIERTDPALAGILTELVEAGQRPEQILGHIRANYPHLWQEAHVIRAAARHLRGIYLLNTEG